MGRKLEMVNFMARPQRKRNKFWGKKCKIYVHVYFFSTPGHRSETEYLLITIKEASAKIVKYWAWILAY